MAKIITDEQKIKEIFERGVEEIIEKESLEKKLKSGKQLRIKFGVDPTSPNLHLGHSVPLKKLKELQNAGHKIVLIIGDFTAAIGDPSGQSKTRLPLSAQEIKKNMKSYLNQAKKVIDIEKTEVHYNSEWLDKLKGAKILELLSLVSVQQMTEREDFHKRISEHKPVRIHEFFYPILQAYDSVITKPDIELGGIDQKFNLLMGRDLMEKFKLLPQDIITVPLLLGTDGIRKMSKSYDNYISLTEKPDQMFGKTMSITDDLIIKYFTLLTNLSAENLAEISRKIENGENPRDIKIELAEEIVKLYYNNETAEKAKEEFIKVFSKKEFPDDIKTFYFKHGINITDILLGTGYVSSKSGARRLITQGGVDVNNKTIDNPKQQILNNDIIRAGKKYFFKIIYS